MHLNTRSAFLIGHPVAQSLSPFIHNGWMRAHDIGASYETVDITPEELPSFLNDARQSAACGFNVTVPHKIAVYQACDTVSDEARAIGAVNTVKIENGQLYGHNTDAGGYITSLERAVPEINFQEQHVAVLGAGGASRAICYALLKAGVKELRILNRSAEKAIALADDLGRIFTSPSMPPRVSGTGLEGSEIFEETTLLVNTTSLGMTGQPPLQIELGSLSTNAIVSDIVYKPLETDLLTEAKAKGCRTVGGLGMLIHQAAAAFEIWYGIKPEVTDTLYHQLEARL